MAAVRQILKDAGNKALDAEPPVASFLQSMLIGGGPVNGIHSRAKCLCIELVEQVEVESQCCYDSIHVPSIARRPTRAGPDLGVDGLREHSRLRD